MSRRGNVRVFIVLIAKDKLELAETAESLEDGLMVAALSEPHVVAE